jgi:amidase
MVPLGHGTDGGGSIRVPASACGLVGLKPSRGRVSTGTGESMAGMSVEHVLTRTVRDTAAVLDILSGPGAGDPYSAPTPVRAYADEVGAQQPPLRIGAMRRAPGSMFEVHLDAVAAVDETARLLSDAGHIVEEAHPDAIDDPGFLLHYGVLVTVDTAACLDHWSARTGRTIGPGDVEINTWALAELGRTVPGVQVLASRDWLFAFAARMAEWWTMFDLLLTPTLTSAAPPLGSFVSTPENPLGAGAAAASLVPFTPMFNATGQPAISLPVSQSDAGLPVGAQLVGAYGHEDLLIRVAAQLEAACDWAARRPTIYA